MPSFSTPPVITITINGKTDTFNNYYRASGHIHQFIHAEEQAYKDARVKEIEERGVKYVYEAKFMLEHKYHLWVATSKEGKFNVRRDGVPYFLGKEKQFALSGRELIAFYHRYIKIVLLE